MEKKIIIFSAEGCPPCEEVKKRIKDPSKVEIIDLTKNEEAARFAYENDILAVPTAIKKTDNGFERCQIDIKENKVIVKCKDEEIEL